MPLQQKIDSIEPIAHIIEKLEDIQFDKADTNHVWGLNCATHGMYSASNTIIYSEHIAFIFRIQQLYDNSLTGTCYYLYNKETREYLYDLSMYKGNIVYDKKYAKYLVVIRNHYLAWAKLTEKKGLYFIKKNHISPLDGTPFVWKERIV